MDEIQGITAKYDENYIRTGLTSPAAVNAFALAFYKDVAEILDCITRVKNTERNPSGYSLDDAPILGLLVRGWKLLKEIIKQYEASNAEMLGILERPLIEAAIVAQYLMLGDSALVEDYRKCSYKDRLRILRDLEAGSPFFDTKPGQRLLRSVRAKLALEGFDGTSFEAQKRNKWRLGGKTFYHIFGQVEREELYASSYGIMSDSIHASWNDTMDFDLVLNADKTFSVYPFYHPADVRYVTPLLRFVVPAYRLWLKRIDALDEDFEGLVSWVEKINAGLFHRFDALFDEPAA